MRSSPRGKFLSPPSLQPSKRKGAVISHTPYEKIQLKSLHKEIDLFDRKLAHLAKYGEFTTEADRKAAAGKMQRKRDSLAAEAQEMMKSGVEFDPSALPRSFCPEDSPAPAAAPAKTEAEPAASQETQAEPQVFDALPESRHESPFAGTSLDGKRMLEEYKRNKARKEGAEAPGTETGPQSVA